MKINKLEKISINRYTFLDRIIGFEETELTREGSKRNLTYNEIYGEKIKDYQRLLVALEKGYQQKIIIPYMTTPCGRIQVRHAVSKGLVSWKEYCNNDPTRKD